MVETLREKANVSYEEAKAALEASNWDLLDAIVLLEGEGKIPTETSTYSKPNSYCRRNNIASIIVVIVVIVVIITNNNIFVRIISTFPICTII